MIMSNNLSPGVVICFNDKLYRVETCVKSTMPKTQSMITAKLRCLETDSILEEVFKPNQALQQVSLEERLLEFLYTENEEYLFLDINNLEQIRVSSSVIGSIGQYIKEGIEIRATFYAYSVYSVELPQFLELMVADIENVEDLEIQVTNNSKIAVLETGAKIRVPPFIEIGDIIKVDTKAEEYVQRV